MASTLQVTFKISEANSSNGSLSRQCAKTITPVGTLVDSRRVSVATAEITHTISSGITGGSNGVGWAFIQNRDATNYVQVGISAGSYFARLKAGESMLLPLDNAISTLKLKANTAACDVEISIWER